MRGGRPSCRAKENEGRSDSGGSVGITPWVARGHRDPAGAGHGGLHGADDHAARGHGGRRRLPKLGDYSEALGSGRVEGVKQHQRE